MMTPFANQLDRLRRRWRLIVVITLLGGALAAAATQLQATEYTGRAALTTSSQNRSPDQDAYLAQGYAAYFNEPSYQEQLAERLSLPGDVGFQARTAATSPIVYVEATAPDAEVAADAAADLATALREDVNAGLQSDVDERAAQVQEQIDTARVRLTDPIPEVERVQIPQALNELLTRLADIESDTTNQLKTLQLSAGVTSSSPSLTRNVAFGLIGGLVMGAVVALSLGAFRNRLSTPYDVRSALDLRTLAVVPRARRRNGREREQRLRGLANAISLAGLAPSASVAVVALRGGTPKTQVAHSLAAHRALQGEPTLLVQADLLTDVAAGAGSPGVLELLADDRDAARPELLSSRYPDLVLLPRGSSADEGYALFTARRFGRLLKRLTAEVRTVVIDAPPTTEAEALVVCAAADHTVLVVEHGLTLASEAAETVRTLQQAGADVLGVVIIGRGTGSDLTVTATGPAPAESPEAAPAPNGSTPSGSADGEDPIAPSADAREQSEREPERGATVSG